MHVMSQECVSQCHANFTENAPLYVALSGLAELSGRGSPALLHVRIAHIGVIMMLLYSANTALAAQSQFHCVVMMWCGE
jgi:MAPEG family